MTIDDTDFEQLVISAIDSVPEPFATALNDVAVVVVDRAPPPDTDVYGLYIGVPLDEAWVADGELPARIQIYRHPLIEDCETLDELRSEVRTTVLHELGHHLGFDEDDLDRIGLA